MFEKDWLAVAPQLFTVDGSPKGLVQVADTAGFKVKAQVVIQATALPNLTVEVKRVLSKTQMYIGAVNKGINDRSVDLSAYTVAAGAFVYQDQQPRNTVSPADILQAVYDQEPGVRIRVGLVDDYGNSFNENNPLPVSVNADIVVNDVEITKTIGLFNLPYDAILPSYPSSTQEQYQSYIGGLSGTPVQLVTVNYTDATKNFILNVTRVPTG